MNANFSQVTPAVWPTLRPGVWAGAVLPLAEYLDGRASLGAAELPAGGRHYHGLGLIGLADDEGVRLNGGRLGAREGPAALRQALARYGSAASPELPKRRPLVVDVGDVTPGRDLNETHDRITETAAEMLRLGLMPVGIGGGHDLTFPLVRAVANDGGELLAGVYFDAHLDVRETPGSGMSFRRLVEDCGVRSLRCVGLDRFANSKEHIDWFAAHGGSLDSFDAGSWPGVPPRQFVSIDLDVLDAAHAPGVSAMNPAGMTTVQLAAYAYRAGLSPSVCCFDVMELSPPHDPDGRTARVAAHLLLRFIQGCAGRIDRRGT